MRLEYTATYRVIKQHVFVIVESIAVYPYGISETDLYKAIAEDFCQRNNQNPVERNFLMYDAGADFWVQYEFSTEHVKPTGERHWLKAAMKILEQR